MRGTISHTQLPAFDLAELSLMQLATMSNDLNYLHDAAPDTGTVCTALEAFGAALRAEILSRPCAEYAGAIAFMLRILDRPTRHPEPPVHVYQLQRDRSVLHHLLSILSPDDAE